MVACSAGAPALPERRPLITRPAGTRCRSSARRRCRTRGDRDEAGQVLVLGPQAVQHPRAHRRPDEVRRAAVQEQRRRAVGDPFGVQRVDEAQVVDVPADLGKQLRDPAAASGRAGRTSRAASSRAASRRRVPVLAMHAGVVERHLLAVVLRPAAACSRTNRPGSRPPCMNRKITRLARGGKCGAVREARRRDARLADGLLMRPAPTRPGSQSRTRRLAETGVENIHCRGS